MSVGAGFNAKIFVGSAGAAQPATEITIARDTSNENNGNAIDASSRKSKHKKYIYGQADYSINANILDDPDDPAVKIIREAYINQEVISVFDSDGNGNGVKGDFIIGTLSQGRPLNDVMTLDVTFNPAANGNDVVWVGE